MADKLYYCLLSGKATAGHFMDSGGINIFQGAIYLNYIDMSNIPQWSSGFPYGLQLKSEFGNRGFMI